MLGQEREWKEGCEPNGKVAIPLAMTPYHDAQLSLWLCSGFTVHQRGRHGAADISVDRPGRGAVVATKEPGYHPHFQGSVEPNDNKLEVRVGQKAPNHHFKT